MLPSEPRVFVRLGLDHDPELRSARATRISGGVMIGLGVPVAILTVLGSRAQNGPGRALAWSEVHRARGTPDWAQWRI